MDIEDLFPDDEEDLGVQGALESIPEGIHTGVSVSWLMAAFRMDRVTVKRKLAKLTPIKYGRGNSPIYDFVQAASCLVKPNIDIAEYLKTMRPQDLPALLQKEYWDAKLKRQKWEIAAGELWHTSDVVSVLGDTFQMMKNTLLLWTEHIDREVGLSEVQYAALTKKVDILQEDMYEKLVEMENLRQTPSSLDGPDEEV